MRRHCVHVIIPGLTPPSVNDYVRHPARGVHFKTPEARSYHDAVVMFARQAESQQGSLPKGIQYEVFLAVYFGKGERGDIDNRAKVPIDALVSARLIDTDSSVIDLHLHKRRDSDNPRTEIWVREAVRGGDIVFGEGE